MRAGPEPRWSAAELEAVVARLAAEISADHPEGVFLVGVLRGSLCLVADLLRRLSVPCTVDFLALSPYVAGAARVRILKDLDLDVAGRDVVLVEDIVDTGLSSGYVTTLLRHRGARRVSLCALLDRPSRRILPIELAYRGLDASEEFLVGYGLDYGQRYRNLPGIFAVSPEELEGDPATVNRRLYGAEST